MSEEDRLYKVIKAAFTFLGLYASLESIGMLDSAMKLLKEVVQEHEGEIDPEKLVDWLEVYLKNKQVRN